MKIIALMSSFIYIISSSLLYPVLILLSFFTIWILFQAGRFCADWLSRTKFSNGNTINGILSEIQLPSQISPAVSSFYKQLVSIMDADDRTLETRVEYLLQHYVWQMEKELDFCRMMVRIGPMLGLMGTLIPMGTGLAALSQGDMGRLSSDLVIAFTTTVVGLAQGGLAYAIYNTRKRWVEKDILHMEFITEILMEKRQRADEEVHNPETTKISVAIGR